MLAQAYALEKDIYPTQPINQQLGENKHSADN